MNKNLPLTNDEIQRLFTGDIQECVTVRDGMLHKLAAMCANFSCRL
jgi:hypothetical protein